MYLSADHKFNIAMRMLGIVEGMVNLKPTPPPQPTTMAKPVIDDSHDDELNAMIKEQLRSAGPEYMNSEE